MPITDIVSQKAKWSQPHTCSGCLWQEMCKECVPGWTAQWSRRTKWFGCANFRRHKDSHKNSRSTKHNPTWSGSCLWTSLVFSRKSFFPRKASVTALLLCWSSHPTLINDFSQRSDHLRLPGAWPESCNQFLSIHWKKWLNLAHPLPRYYKQLHSSLTMKCYFHPIFRLTFLWPTSGSSSIAFLCIQS